MQISVTDDSLTADVKQALYEVYDPEIPALSVLDLGMVRAVSCTDGRAHVQLTPTFMGCPALAMIERAVVKRVGQVEGVSEVQVEFVYDEPWTTERMTETGKQRLKEFGIAPPACSLLQMKTLTADCPYCGSAHTRVENLFGPTACRAVFYCDDCHQPFEGMKPV